MRAELWAPDGPPPSRVRGLLAARLSGPRPRAAREPVAREALSGRDEAGAVEGPFGRASKA